MKFLGDFTLVLVGVLTREIVKMVAGWVGKRVIKAGRKAYRKNPLLFQSIAHYWYNHPKKYRHCKNGLCQTK